MRAIDTNVVVRLIAQDDPAQASAAQTLLTEDFLVLPSVLMEAVWVLTSAYSMSRADVSRHLRTLLGYPLAVVASGDVVLWALDRYDEGADFADMLHLALAAEEGASSFATFDTRIRRVIDPPIGVETVG